MVRKLVTVVSLVGALSAVSISPAFANASAPTNGGNGAGQSGQCTGPPSGRPMVCPAT